MLENAIESLRGMAVLVLGLGVSGRSAAAFLVGRGAHVVCADDHLQALRANAEVVRLHEKGVRLIGPEDPLPFMPDLVVVSPGIPPNHPGLVEARKKKWEVIGEIELAGRYLRNRIVAVTGTNGKTTVTLLTAHVLNESGFSAQALGNSGVPLTSFLSLEKNEGSSDILVVELSSFQLETLHSQCLDAAVLLNITPDHLDRYDSMEQYAAAKLKIRSCLRPGGSFFAADSCARRYSLSDGLTYGYRPENDIYTDLEKVFIEGKPAFALPKSLQGKRSHDTENLMAAFALCHKCGVSSEAFIEAFQSFRKPPHRIEFVCSRNGIAYVNDSKGTNLDAVVKAVHSTNGAVVLIAGGVDKGAAYTPWIKEFAGKVRCIYAIGQAAKKIEADLDKHIPVHVCQCLKSAIIAASQEAVDGETVLLSPGCSSYDMFRDYVHRGDEFKRLVLAL